MKLKTILVNSSIGIVIGLLAGTCHYLKNYDKNVEEVPKEEPISIVEEIKEEEFLPKQEEIKVIEPDLEEEYYYDSLEYLACLVESESGNQDEYGKRLVCDVVLNRVDSEQFPNDICSVIDQKGQFQVVSNGAIAIEPSEETYKVVKEEIQKRTNNEVLYFRTNQYHVFAIDLFKHNAHYFSK